MLTKSSPLGLILLILPEWNFFCSWVTYTSLWGHSLPVVHSPIAITVIRFKYKSLLRQPALKHSDISFTFSIHFHSLLIRLCLQDANYESTRYLIMLIYTIIWTDFPFYLSAPRTNLHVLSPVPFSRNLLIDLVIFSYFSHIMSEKNLWFYMNCFLTHAFGCHE